MTASKPAQMVRSAQEGDNSVLTLKEFVEKNYTSFPLRVRIEEGEFSSEDSLSIGDVYTLKVTKTTASVLVKCDSEIESRVTTIPVTCPVEYGIIYANSHGAASPIKTVKDLMEMKPLPYIVCATRSHETGDKRTSVAASEVLIVQRVKSKYLRKHLQVYSPSTGLAKFLLPNCAGFFVTEMAQTKLNMATILRHTKLMFPIQAQVFCTGRESFPIPHFFNYHPVIVEEMVYIQTVLASIYSEDQQDVTSDIIELPVNLPVTVSLFERRQRDKMASGIAYNKQKPCLTNGKDLGFRVSFDSELKKGIETRKDNRLMISAEQSAMSGEDNGRYQIINTTVTCVSHMPDRKEAVNYAPLVSSTKQNVEKSNYDTPSLVKENLTLSELQKAKQRMLLKQLGVEQVCALLEELGLGEHVQMFCRENVTGEILMECPDEVLRDELRIFSPTQRRLLLDAKEGNVDIQQVLKKYK